MLWQQVREFIPVAAFVVLCFVSVHSALANIDKNDSASTATTTMQTQTAAATDGTRPKEAKSEASSKPPSRSVLDDEMLSSPISYFREAFSSEEDDDTDTAPGSDAVTMTVMALVAALLSTIL